MTWNWVDRAVVLAIHDAQVAEHGGLPGLRDAALLESALARPRNLAAYGTPDVADLAASHAFGLARNHAFIDGNKRVTFVVTELFLGINGVTLTATDPDCYHAMIALADGSDTEAAFAAWVRANTSP